MKICYDPQAKKWTRNGMLVELFLTRLKEDLANPTDFAEEWLKDIYKFVKEKRMYSKEQEKALRNIEKILQKKEDEYYDHDSSDGDYYYY